MGYQVGVTPLQMASAVSSVANGGELVQPRVVRAVIRDGARRPVPRKVLGRAIDRATAATLTDDYGSRRRTTAPAVPRRSTASPSRARPAPRRKFVNGRYSNTDYNVSFVGFVPSRKPVFTIVVVVDSPHRRFHRAAPRSPRRSSSGSRQPRCVSTGVPPSINPAPPLLVARREPEEMHEQPTSTAGIAPNIVTVDGGTHAAQSLVPDLRGLSARDALRTLSRLGMSARLNGAGIVVRQLPEAGAPIDPRHLVNALARAATGGDAVTVRELLQASMRRCHPRHRPDIRSPMRALDVPCTGVAYDSRQVKRGSVFVALPGQKVDGAAFAPQAIAAGAVAVVSERAVAAAGAPWIVVAHARLALAQPRSRILRASEPADDGRRHYRHER